jgi:hypothetical protein
MIKFGVQSAKKKRGFTALVITDPGMLDFGYNGQSMAGM